VHENVASKDCFVIEDSPAGVEGALAAKMTVLAFGGGKHITAKIRQRLKDSGAYVFFDQMSDLKEIINALSMT
jgi:beta-phosphoglucomutase-like phosphatase (HAD superfamily)